MICFDLDGTLCDTQEGILRSLHYALEGLGIDPGDRDLWALIGPPLQEIFSDGFDLDPPGVENAMRIYREFYADEGIFMNTPYPGMPKLLRDLAASSAKLTVCTAKPWVYAEKLLRAHDLLECFDFVSGPELDGTRRTKPEIITHALDNIREAAGDDIVMIGDRHYDITGSRALGLPSIGVDWGFAPPGELDAAAPTWRASSTADLRPLLLA